MNIATLNSLAKLHKGSIDQLIIHVIRAKPKRKSNMKDDLGPRFPKAVSDLVSWFGLVERHFDLNTLQTVNEEILSENGNMSDFALQTAIRKRYAEKINAVLQIPAVQLNTADTENSKVVTRFEFAPLTGPSDIRLFKFRKFITLGDQMPYFSCKIVYVNLGEHPDYTGISYVWGPLDKALPVLIGDDKFIMVSGKFHGSPLPILGRQYSHRHREHDKTAMVRSAVH